MSQATSIDPQELTGLKALDARGDVLGEIQAVYYDADTDEPAWVAVELSGRGVTLVPFAGSTAREDGLQVAYHGEWVASAPASHDGAPDEVTDDEEAALFAHYGATSDSSPPRQRPLQADRNAGSEEASSAVERAGAVVDTARQESRRLATVSGQQAQQVAHSAAEEAKAVLGTAKQQATRMAEEATAQARNLLDDTRHRLHSEAVGQTQGLADRVRQLAEEATALTEGRPYEAPTARNYVTEASSRLMAAAERLDQAAADVDARGVGALFDDLQRFGRRRPALFLLGATAVGFAVGRVIRNRPSEEELAAGSDGGDATRQGR